MADKPAQNELDTKYGTAKATQADIIEDGTTDKWTGELVIDGYAALKEINITDNKITKLIIKNCPKLEKIDINDNKMDIVDLSGIGAPNVLKEFYANDNQLTELNLKNCTEIKKLKLRDNATLTKVRGLEDIKDIDELDLTGTPNVKLVHEDKFGDYEQTKDAIKDLLGDLNSAKGSDGKIDKDKLKEQIENKAGENSPQKQQAEQAAQEAKGNLNGAGTELGLTGDNATNKDEIINKIKELKNQAAQAVNNLLTEINNLGLGLTGNDITKDKIFAKIKELINKPTTSCTHTDYDAIKAERDRLKNENKENENRGVTKEVLVENTKENFQKWGISETAYKDKLATASAQDVEKLKNELIGKRFTELGKENKTSFYLNIGLGTIAFVSLLVIGWLLMRETNLPKTDPEDKKEPEKKKK